MSLSRPFHLTPLGLSTEKGNKRGVLCPTLVNGNNTLDLLFNNSVGMTNHISFKILPPFSYTCDHDCLYFKVKIFKRMKSISNRNWSTLLSEILRVLIMMPLFIIYICLIVIQKFRLCHNEVQDIYRYDAILAKLY